MMNLKNDKYYNTGGGCMVMYVDVENGGQIVELGVNDELVVAYSSKYEEGKEPTELWWTDNFQKLEEYLGKEIAEQLYRLFLKYEENSCWYPLNEYGRQLSRFYDEVGNSQVSIMDDIHKGVKALDKYDLCLTINGKEFNLMFNSQLYEDLIRLTVKQIDQYGTIHR